MFRSIAIALACLPFACAWGAPALQPLIDATPTGGILRPAPGTYAGPALIVRPMILDGQDRVTLDNGGKGTVLTVRADRVTVRGLHLTGTGNSHDGTDAAILVEGAGNRIEDNRIEDALFGIHLKQAKGNLVRGNRIRSKSAAVSLRGDGIRLWYSMDNRIEDNDISAVRDFTMINSPRNRIVGNRVRDSRYGLHLIFSGDSVVEGNLIEGNVTGIVAIYSEGMLIRRNRVLHALDTAGSGITLHEANNSVLEDNEIVHCAVGVLTDSPMHATERIVLRGNRIAHNVTGVLFYGEPGTHVVHGNRFENNLVQAVTSGVGDPLANDWSGNYWDDYQGFDRNHDGIGDTPYELLAYADRIWMETPVARFFRNSPGLELLDFLERLAPFSSPQLILRDPAPRMAP